MARTGTWAMGPAGSAGPADGIGPRPGRSPELGEQHGVGEPRRERWSGPARWLAGTTLAGLAVVVVLVAGAARRHGAFARADTAISRWSLAHQTPGWSRLMHDVSHLGDVSLIVPVALAVVGITAAAGLPRPAGFIAVTAGSGIAVAWILERVLGTSPASGDPLVLDGPGAFPSGHTAVATAVFGAVAVTVATARWPAAVRWLTVAILVAAVVLVGLSRIYDRAHWPSDVGFGWLLSTAWVLAATIAVGPRWLRHRSDP